MPWLESPPDGEHVAAAESLVALWLLDALLGERIAALYWVSGGVSQLQTAVVGALHELAARDLALAHTVLDYPWMADDLTDIESSAVFALKELAELYLALAKAVAEYPWLADDVTDHERWGLSHLLWFVVSDVALARTVAGLPWLADGVTDAERGVLSDLQGLAEYSAAFARSVVALPWLADDVSDAERVALSELLSIWEVEPAFAQSVMSLPLFGDGVSDGEREVLTELFQLWEFDPAFAKSVMSLPWIVDGVSDAERGVFLDLSWFAKTDFEFAKLVIALPWLAGGITQTEGTALTSLRSISEQDKVLAGRLAGLPWLVDGITEAEAFAFYNLQSLVETDLELARTVMETTWINDDASEVEVRALASISMIARDGMLDELRQAPWYADGLNDEDMALLTAMGLVRGFSPSLYDDLIQSYDARARAISLPLAGDMRLWAFNPGTFLGDDDPLKQVEEAMRAIEAFMSEPFPNSDVVMVTSYETEYAGDTWDNGGAWNGRSYFFVARQGELSIWRPTVYHKVARYYFGDGRGPSWLVEGGVRFMESITMESTGQESLEERRPISRMEMERDCRDDNIHNIQQLPDIWSHRCSYAMGEHFLITLTLTLGKNTSSAALRELYLVSRHDWRPATEEDIYRAFLKHTPPELESEFRALYKQLHGGTYDDEG